ncbi:MAG: gliding motility-associated C-terminal domain-containing protein [Cytophagales bacterium]|nr:MAG: gliding motility-associated C-terminal domain-containing protein [Cytophagales bacterium]TAF61898.1 MAG: gliding motility-associated C-terminal domain-containing protein [Cytophagales bacterium]
MMKKIILSILLLFCVVFGARATHIVGGEIEMTYISGNRYKVCLYMYFDAVNGNPAAIDPTVTVNIFRKIDNAQMESITLRQVSNTLVPYTQPECASGDLITRKITYCEEYVFNRDGYTHPNGYYISWERCCRNSTIVNILSPGEAGQAFYLEFPRLKDASTGFNFINSSPTLFPPLSDYACANQPFFFNFGGKDLDGDVLKYRLVAPLNGFSSTTMPLPPPSPGPYPNVIFFPGIGVANMIPGAPPLIINPTTGVLTLKAFDPGLYVFAVAVDEFRGGIKIGEVRREFQLLVLNCPSANPPSAKLFEGTSTTPYVEGNLITIEPDENRCGRVVIEDIDPSTVVTASIEPLNFTSSDVVITPNNGTISGSGAKLELKICFPECPNKNGDPYKFNIIVADNSCAVPLLDTIEAQVLIKSLPNDPPTISTSLLTKGADSCYKANVAVGETLTFDVIGNDVNFDDLEITGKGRGFDIASVATISFTGAKGKPILKAPFKFQPACDLLKPGEKEKFFTFDFEVKDRRKCDSPLVSKTCVTVRVTSVPDSNKAPVITPDKIIFDPVTKLYNYPDTILVGQKGDFNLLCTDEDGDSMKLKMAGVNFTLPGRLISLKPEAGVASFNSAFLWQTQCKDLKDLTKAQEFILDIFLQDLKPCNRLGATDTIRVRFIIKPVTNQKPTVTTTLATVDPAPNCYRDSVNVGQLIKFTVKGFDPDGDTLLLTGKGNGFNFADFKMIFENKTGVGTVSSDFSWRTSCDMLKDLTKPQEFNMTFIVQDKKTCANLLSDTTCVTLVLLPNNAPNTAPKLSASLFYDASEDLYIDTVIVGNATAFDILCKDDENDSVSIKALPEGFALSDFNMIFRDTSGFAPLKAPFFWQTLCEYLGIKPDKTFERAFFINFVAKDYNECKNSLGDTIRVKILLRFLDKPNEKPDGTALGISFDASKGMYYRRIKAGEVVTFDIRGTDPENNTIKIEAAPRGFSLTDAEMEFTDRIGLPPLTAKFRWPTSCELLGKLNRDSVYIIDFLVTDLTNCKVTSTDTVTVRLDLTANPDNTPPTIVAEGIEFNTATNLYERKLIVGETITFNVVGDDADRNTITLTAEGIGFDMTVLGMAFESVSGAPRQTSTFTWTPTCEMLGGATRKDFVVEFNVSDQTQCGLTASQPILAKLTVVDEADSRGFLPPNVFTPNGDGKNDFYTIPDLPLNTCQDAFERIVIFNRWGKQVFESSLRDFKWDGVGFPAGTYNYLIKYRSTTYKGNVLLLRD